MKTYIPNPSQLSGIADGSITVIRMPIDDFINGEVTPVYEDDILVAARYYRMMSSRTQLSPFAIGDKVACLEEWWIDGVGENQYKKDYAEDKDFEGLITYNPASTMPIEFARTHIEVMSINVEQTDDKWEWVFNIKLVKE